MQTILFLVVHLDKGLWQDCPPKQIETRGQTEVQATYQLEKDTYLQWISCPEV